MLRAYYYLTKPGIICGNAVNTIAGFFLAATSHSHYDLWKLLAVLVGSSLVIASGCVYNNYIDRGIDQHMARTKKRALVTGKVSGRNALLFASILGAIGFATLTVGTNLLTVGVGVIGLISYVALYGYSKRHTIYGTLIGSISGATPPLAGYVALTGALDAGALIIFLILVLWQMPHFYAISMYRRDEYAAANIPVWSVAKGMHSAKIQIILFTIAFTAATSLLTVYGYTGYTYLVVMLGVGAVWIWRGVQGFKTTDDKKWGRKMFFFSLIVTLVTALMVSVGPLLP